MHINFMFLILLYISGVLCSEDGFLSYSSDYQQTEHTDLIKRSVQDSDKHLEQFTSIPSSLQTFQPYNFLVASTNISLNNELPVLQTASALLRIIQKDYDRLLRPNFGKEAVIVDISIVIDGIGPVSHQDMEFTMDFFFRQIWQDSRLEYVSSRKYIQFGPEVSNKIWKPDTYFLSAVETSVLAGGSQNSLIRIYFNGKVLVSERIRVTSKCFMKMTYFPLDTQKCSLLVGSYGYTEDDIKYQWYLNDSVSFNNGISKIQIPQFHFKMFSRHINTHVLSTGNYSYTKLSIYLQRNIGVFLLQVYLPAALIVTISWVTFWVQRSAVPARASIGVTAVLTMMTLTAGGVLRDPSSKSGFAEVTPMDVYVGVCFMYVVAGLIEFAFVGYFDKPRYRLLKWEDLEACESYPEGDDYTAEVSKCLHQNGFVNRCSQRYCLHPNCSLNNSGNNCRKISASNNARRRRLSYQPHAMGGVCGQREFRSARSMETQPVMSRINEANMVFANSTQPTRVPRLEKTHNSNTLTSIAESNSWPGNSFEISSESQKTTSLPRNSSNKNYNAITTDDLHNAQDSHIIIDYTPEESMAAECCNIQQTRNLMTSSPLSSDPIRRGYYGFVAKDISTDTRNSKNCDKFALGKCKSCLLALPRFMMSLEATRADIYSRIMFPLTFLLFNLLYWFIFIVKAKQASRLLEEDGN